MALAQRLHDGQAARHRRLVGQHAAVARGGGGQRLAVLGQQGLVGGHHMLAVGQCGQRPGARGLGAARQLQQHVHAGVGGELQRVGQQAHAGRVAQQRGGAGRAARGHGHDLDAAPRARGDQRLVAPQQPPHAAAHGAGADEAHAQGGGLGRGVRARGG
jgi:hypothetical protein